MFKFNYMGKYVDKTEDEIRAELEWSREREKVFGILNSISNQRNRKPYVPTTDEDIVELKLLGYIRKNKRKELTATGRAEYLESLRIEKEFNCIMGWRGDILQERSMFNEIKDTHEIGDGIHFCNEQIIKSTLRFIK